MAFRDLLIAILVTFIWALNFVVMRFGLSEIPPPHYLTLRILFSVFPLIFFIKRPPISIKALVGIGVSVGLFHFLFMMMGMSLGVNSPITSLVIQTQGFFTILMAFLILSEKPKIFQIGGMVLSFMGVALISFDRVMAGSIIGILFILGSALSVGIGNVLIRRATQNTDISLLSVIVWMSLIPPVPLLGYALEQQGVEASLQILQQASLGAYMTVVYSALISGVIGHSLWAYLLKKYQTSKVVPFTMLVPVFTTALSVPFFHDVFSKNDLWGAFLVFLGLFVSQFYGKIRNLIARLR